MTYHSSNNIQGRCQGSDVAPIFGNLSQSVNLSDIKSSLGMLPTFFSNFISTMFYLEVDSLMRVLNVVDSGLHPLLQSRAAPFAVCFQGCCNMKKYLFIFIFQSKFFVVNYFSFNWKYMKDSLLLF